MATMTTRPNAVRKFWPMYEKKSKGSVSRNAIATNQSGFFGLARGFTRKDLTRKS